MDEEEFNKGLILPHLLTQLRKILDQYPDDTQILKELVQNAEDAGATQVKFLYDRHAYGTDPRKLYCSGLSKYQGPALYAYNDGLFTDNDWRGLRMLSDSVKHGDPFKVGYFGMGFKSVFHVTDLPSVISGDKLAYIDPHQQLFDASSHAFNLSKHPELWEEMGHQIEPYLGVFDCSEETFKGAFYNGTLFRFPLRLAPSQLSAQAYSHDKVMALIEGFRSEAPLLPLFLRHVERIEVHSRDRTIGESRLVFSTAIAESCIEDVRQKRRDFQRKIASKEFSSKPVISTYKIAVVTSDHSNPSAPVTIEHKFLVTNYYCSGQVSAAFSKLSKDSELNYLPVVGVAMPLHCPESGRDVYELNERDGRFFCFLPLSLEEGYSSGLPVHINGFFALEQNRKHIKWPGVHVSRMKEDLMDKRLLWNVCLLKEALPKCYFHLLSEAIRLNGLLSASTNGGVSNGDSSDVTEEMIYRAFPSFDKIDRRWENLLLFLYSELFKYPTIRTAAEGGRWIEPRLAVFNTLDPSSEISRIVSDVLLEGSVRVARVPPHVIGAIRKCCRINVIEASPSLVANTCRSLQRSRNSSVLTRLSDAQKIELLGYFVAQNKFDVLDGLDLLPLADGTFHTFYYNPKKADRPIYIAVDPELLRLLPGVGRDLLFTGLDDDVNKRLIKAATKGMTQLKILDTAAIGELIPRCFPVKWRHRIGKTSDLVQWMPGSPGQPEDGWLEMLWNFLAQHSPRDLSAVEKMPVLPGKTFHNDRGEKVLELFPLFDSSSVRILRLGDGMRLGDEVENVLNKLGVVIIDDLPDYVTQHSLVLRNFVFPPNYLGVLRAIGRLCEIVGGAKVMNALKRDTSVDDKRCLRELFAKISVYEMHNNFPSLLANLPLFETVQSWNKDPEYVPRFVSFSECDAAAPLEPIDFPLSSPLLDVSDTSSQALGRLLGVRQLNLIQLLETVVFRDIEEAFYEREQVKEVMMHVLKLYHRFSGNDREKLKRSLQSLPFMERHNGLFVQVSHFYDPEHALLKKLFRFEKRFPDESYLAPAVLPILREIGLRNLDDVEAEDIKESAEIVEDLTTAYQNGDECFGKLTVSLIKEKASAIVEIIHKFPEKLNDECGVEKTVLGVALRPIKWVLCDHQKPSLYPKSLLWHGSKEQSSSKDEVKITAFEKPENIVSRKYLLLAGSVMPVPYGDFSPSVEIALDWSKAPRLDVVVKHLYNVVTSYSNQDKITYSEMIKHVYTELASHDFEGVRQSMDQNNVPEAWIWNGEGFVSKERVVFNAPFMDLRPFVYSLPVEMTQFADFLESFAGLKRTCSLVDVLRLIRNKYSCGGVTSPESGGDGAKLSFSPVEVRKDLHLCVCILNELKSHVRSCETNEKRMELLEDFKINLHLPILCENLSILQMAPLSDCTYCDEEWLRQGYSMSDFGIGDIDEGHNQISLVHPNVPIGTSEALGVPTLMSRMLDAEELDISFGQSDSLTHRLNTLLLEYSDGFAIPKELVQNADDAGATEVCFLYDERENEDARTCLLDEGMKECQGPALWVYNDATFEDSDFENITKLNGATKLGQTEKIGRFGLGFNAVYNLTDVPSFVSRHNIVIFDPHTHHLGKSIKDKRKPGIRIDLRRHKRNLRRFGNQFKPYNGIFGCDLRPDSELDCFNGTLFRFPLRTRSQAARSEISSKHYDDREVKELIRMLTASCNSLLLFSQNVVKVSVQHLPKKGNPSADIVQLFSAEKTLVKIIRELPALSGNGMHLVNSDPSTNISQKNQYCSLKIASDILKKIRKNGSPDLAKSLNSSIVIRLNSQWLESSKSEKFLDPKFSKQLNSSQEWLICTCLGARDSLEMAIRDETLTSCVSVAARIHEVGENSFVPQPIESHALDSSRSSHEGSIFSFMPLPIRSGLPVHINGAFAVTSNRKFLCAKNDDDKFDPRPVWNKVLLEDAVSEAYLKLLEDLTNFWHESSSCKFYILWPNPDFAAVCCEPLLDAFYRKLTALNPASPFPLFSDELDWAPFTRTMYLDFSFARSEIGSIAYDVFRGLSAELLNNNCLVAFLPDWLEKTFNLLSGKSGPFENSFDIHRFFTEIFFPSISSIPDASRDKLLICALSYEDDVLNSLIASNNCIPASPDGSALKSVRDLVDPTSFLAKMFVESDGRFPFKSSPFMNPDSLRLLRSIGIKNKIDQITWEDLLERAEAISVLESDEATLKLMVSTFLSVIGEVLENNRVTLDKKSSLNTIRDKIVKTAFLPIMKKPKSYPLVWKGDEFSAVTLIKPSDSYPPKYSDLVSCVRPIVDMSVFPPHPRLELVEEFLFLDSSRCEPTIDDVLDQLDSITEAFAFKEENSKKSFDYVQSMCFKIYDFFQQQAAKVDTVSRRKLLNVLKNKSFIITQEAFLSPDKLAFNFQHSVCSPYLFTLSDNLKRNFYELMKLSGVRDHFGVPDYVGALQEMKKDHSDNSLDKQTLKKALCLVNCLNDCMAEEHLILQDVLASFGTIYIPDADNRLKSASDLCYNEPECRWLPSNESLSLSHPLIPFAISKQLGVNTYRLEVLKKHSSGIPFGQREKLTSRIRRILSGYPFDKEILKELLQNADDAGATEICFIKDTRHHGTERIFDKSWQPLQGPALCVYNNKAFAENDLESIQKLGEGSKREDPNKTGQYGVGFNCVYHLTDVPSFLTKGSNISETLCVFDPHAKFVPGSTVVEPGRRFENVDQLKSIFTDVISCYLGDKFDLENGTMFRLPLRTHEMAKSSEISDRSVSLDDIDDLFRKFSFELSDCLLFLNNIRHVSLCEIEKMTGKVTILFKVSSEICSSDVQSMKVFSQKLADKAPKVKSGKLADLGKINASYVVKISGSKGETENWLVSKTFGFDSDVKVPEKVVDAFRSKELILMPLGGVAAPLTKNSTKGTKQNACRLYCFLPLPVKSEFPVHVNGHFAVDYEARRNVWYDDREADAKTEWNKLLFEHVVSSAYVSLLEKLTTFVSESCTDESLTSVDLNHYNSLLPRIDNEMSTYWKICGINFYRTIACQKINVLPVLLGFSNGKEEMGKSKIQWTTVSSGDHVEAVFDDLDETFLDEQQAHFSASSPIKKPPLEASGKRKSDMLRNVLISLNYPLLALPMSICDCFVMSGLEAPRVTPVSVINYFHVCSPSFSKCHLAKLPRSIAETPLASCENLKVLQEYCSRERTYFSANIEGLPLLLTSDDCLRSFSSKNPVYCSNFSQIFPGLGHKFVHPSLSDQALLLHREIRTEIFLELDIRAFSKLLLAISPDGAFASGSKIPKHVMKDTGPFSANWLRQVWTFLREEYGGTLDDEKLHLAMKPIDDWCLLPVCISSNNAAPLMRQLLPLKHLKIVMDYSKTSILNATLKTCLKKISVPELDREVLDLGNGSSYGIDKTGPNYAFAKKLVSSFDDPASVLLAVCHAVEERSAELLEISDCMTLLKYFTSTLDAWKTSASSITLLKKLPIYVTTEETLTSLIDHEAFVLTEEVPKFSLQAWKTSQRSVFLRCNPLFSDLYAILECRSINPSILYTDFILPNFSLIEPSAWLFHVQFVKDKIFMNATNSEKQLILSILKDQEFIPQTSIGSSSTYSKASQFYDPRNPVFKVMFLDTPQVFPQPPFNDHKWLEFLKRIGLQCSLTKELFVKFSREIEQDGQRYPTEKTIEKSKSLINDLFTAMDLQDVEFLQAISTIKFIPVAKGKSMYQNIFPSYGSGSSPFLSHKFISFQEGIPEQHEALVWSSSHLLPDWANPFKMVGRLPASGSASTPEELSVLKTKVCIVLGVKEKPSIELVMSHLQNLCSESTKTSQRTDENRQFNSFMRNDTVKKIYHYLQCLISEPATDDDEELTEMIQKLSNIPCVLAGIEQRFVYPRHIVIDMREEDQILPYLFKAPTELGGFKELFLKLGATLKATAKQYADVLATMYGSLLKKRLHPNELRLAFKAVKGFFGNLHGEKSNLGSLDCIESLHLPTTDGFLFPSSEIICNDEPAWAERVKKMNAPFLINLSECGLTSDDHLETVRLLPDHLKPKMLTSVVKEVLEERFDSSRILHNVADKLRYQLSSKAFSLGVARLIKHEQRKKRQSIPRQLFETVEQQLSGVHVYSVESVQTYLLCTSDGRRIPESENVTQCFVEKRNHQDDDDDSVSWDIYINKTVKLDDELQVCIAEVVNKITGGLLKNSIHYIQPILSCPPHTISKVLDRLKIRPDRHQDVFTSVLPAAGSFIPIEDHHLLKQDFELFEAGEYVGFELDDQLSGEATIIYAIVVQIVRHGSNSTHVHVSGFFSPENTQSKTTNGHVHVHSGDEHERKANMKERLLLKYLISVGDEREHVEVSAADLYKFQRVDRFFSASSPSTSSSSPKLSTDATGKLLKIDSDKYSPVFEPFADLLANRGNLLTVPGTSAIVPRKLFGSEQKTKRNASNDDVFEGGQNQSNGTGSPKLNKSSTPTERQCVNSKADDGDELLNADDVKNEISSILEAAWEMPEDQRKKIIKRLLLKWHPDKNLDNQHFSTDITQYIYSKIETLELNLEFRSNVRPDPRNPFSNDPTFQENFYNAYQFYANLNRRAKEHKEQRERYKENFSREFSSRSERKFDFGVPPTFASTNPQPAQAKRFLRQAQEDLKAAKNDFEITGEPAFEWACFKAHQAAEKSLKAAQFYVDASISFSHDLVALAASLEDLELRKLAQHLQKIVGNSNKLYNPEPIDFVVIPHDEYTRGMAESSVDLSRLILARVTEIIELKD